MQIKTQQQFTHGKNVYQVNSATESSLANEFGQQRVKLYHMIQHLICVMWNVRAYHMTMWYAF